MKAATLGALDAADLEGIAREIGQDAASELSGVTDQFIGNLLKQANESKKTLNQFREALSDLPKILSENIQVSDEGHQDNNPPLVFIVDELDRCIPTFGEVYG